MNDHATLCVVLHYGSAVRTWDCVRTLLRLDDVDILVADNDPRQDLSPPLWLDQAVAVVRTGGSLGFACANNLAVSRARRRGHTSVFLLNNDTLVAEDALAKLRAVLAQDAVGAVGPCIATAQGSPEIWACGGVIDRYRLLIAGRQPPADGRPHDVDYLPGAALLCKLAVWDLVGGLPERYYLGFEEAEFALRVRACGYRVVAVPNAFVLHDVGMSSDWRPMYRYNLVRNRLRFGRYVWGQRRGFLLALAATCLWVVQRRCPLRVWARAVRDEIRGEPLDAAALESARRAFDVRA